MSKKIVSIVLTLAMLAAVMCVGVVSASADTVIDPDGSTELTAGATVYVVVNVTGVDDLGSYEFKISYNPNYMTPASDADFLGFTDSTGFLDAYNPSYTSDSVYVGGVFQNGYDCTSTVDLAQVIFTVDTDCTVADLAIDPSALVLAVATEAEEIDTSFAGYYVVINLDGADSDTDAGSSDSDASSDSDSSSDSTSDSDASSDSDGSSDNSSDSSSDSDAAGNDSDGQNDSDSSQAGNDTGDTASTSTDSDATSDAGSDEDSDSDTEGDSDSDSDTKDQDSDEETEDTASSTSSTTSSTSSTTTTTSTVQTAGTIAVVALVLILMAAAGVVVYTKKKADIE